MLSGLNPMSGVFIILLTDTLVNSLLENILIHRFLIGFNAMRAKKIRKYPYRL